MFRVAAWRRIAILTGVSHCCGLLFRSPMVRAGDSVGADSRPVHFTPIPSRIAIPAHGYSPLFRVVDIAWITVVLSLRINRAIALWLKPRSKAIRHSKARAAQVSGVPLVAPVTAENGMPVASQTAWAIAMNSARLSCASIRFCRISAISSLLSWITIFAPGTVLLSPAAETRQSPRRPCSARPFHGSRSGRGH